MKQKEILLFGATGQIGRNLIRKLSQNNYKITAVTRNTHRAGYILKTQANPGYLDIVELKSFDPEKIEKLIKDCDICINLVGILFEKTKNQFKTIHCDLPDLLSQKANKYKIEKFIHMSSLGIENAKDSSYAMSKLEGEKKVKKNFADSIILKPSIVYSVDDKFTTRFMTLLSRLPIMPIYYQGQTKFNPIHVIDLIEIIFKVIGKNVFSQLKFESGTHRVQRVPDTETQGRVHTSAATVAVLPEAEEVDLKINESDENQWKPLNTNENRFNISWKALEMQ